MEEDHQELEGVVDIEQTAEYPWECQKRNLAALDAPEKPSWTPSPKVDYPNPRSQYQTQPHRLRADSKAKELPLEGLGPGIPPPLRIQKVSIIFHHREQRTHTERFFQETSEKWDDYLLVRLALASPKVHFNVTLSDARMNTRTLVH